MIGLTQPCDGAKCPVCHCRHLLPVRVTEWLGRRQEVRECRHCGRRVVLSPAAEKNPADFAGLSPPTLTPLGGVPFLSTRCPCGSDNTKIVQTIQPKGDGTTVRWHKCGDCGQRFKSFQAA